MNWFEVWKRAAQNHKQLANVFLGEYIESNTDEMMIRAVIHQDKVFRVVRKMRFAKSRG